MIKLKKYETRTRMVISCRLEVRAISDLAVELFCSCFKTFSEQTLNYPSVTKRRSEEEALVSVQTADSVPRAVLHLSLPFLCWVADRPRYACWSADPSGFCVLDISGNMGRASRPGVYLPSHDSLPAIALPREDQFWHRLRFSFLAGNTSP